MMVQFDVKRVKSGSESFMVSFDFNKTPVTQIADYIIIAASKHNTSDIHFDPRDEGMMVRFRIDGDCQDYTFVPKAYEKNLTTRLKLLANMNITESRLPQDGAIKGEFGGQYLDMRVSALPLNTGEKIVIRILDYTRSLQGIESLGFHPKNLEKIKRMMGLPNGIILTTGATGSGKSTTTYSILQGLNKPETNVITVEDPIEMNIEGINQVQVNAEIGMTFAAALRSILRQDPNVILIGEIRDSETAQIAVRASITGHLVLSTIHTNNALATVERLLDMNVERYLLSTALSGIISQRLAKMLCTECKIKRPTTKYEKKVFKKYMQMDVNEVWDANPKGCEDCRRGYHGRIAVHEVLELTDELKAAISNENIKKEELAKKVYSNGTITMLQDALIKCLEGKTSFGEVYKTIEIENEDDDNYETEIETEIKEAINIQEEPKVSDDLLETVIQEGHAEVFVPTVMTAAAFSDKNDAALDENAEKVQTEQPKNTTVIMPGSQVPSELTGGVSSAPITNDTTKVIMPSAPVASPATNVIAPSTPVTNDTTKVIMPSAPVASPATNVIAPSTPVVNTTASQTQAVSVEASTQTVASQVQTPTQTQPVNVDTTNTNIEISKLGETMVMPRVVLPPEETSPVENNGLVSNPLNINALPSVQSGAISFINNANYQSAPMTNNVLPTTQQNTGSTAVLPTTLPVKNDTIIEALPSSSITSINPQNNYSASGTLNNQNSNSTISNNASVGIATTPLLPTTMISSGSIGANDFLVQKPLMPTNLVKKD